MAPLCIDLFCGLGGWTDGFLAEGFDVIGFDVDQHVYGEHRYPAQLVLQDVRTLHGSQFRDATMIVASSPCQEFSYRAMPWKRAKALGPPELGMELFAQAARIQREACDAAGRYIPMIQENVRGAQPWVGRAQWHYGSFYLWGDVPALMPVPVKAVKRPGHDWNRFNETGEVSPSGTNNNPARGSGVDGVKQAGLSGPRANGKGDRWFQDGAASSGSKSSARKAASARIAKIPLARYIAQVARAAYQERAA
jgi:hypothetical protein